MRFNQTNPTFELRDYQKRVIREIYGWYRRGQKSVMLVSPTGSGKTITAVHVIRDALIRGSRVLFIVHREPLIDQTVNTLTAYGIPSEQIGYIKAGYPPCRWSRDGHCRQHPNPSQKGLSRLD